jgi:hypothetical protein
MRNDVWLNYYCPRDWITERPIEIAVGMSQYCIIPDANFTLEGQLYLVEVDRTQPMTKNKEKIDYYARIIPLIISSKQYSKPPVLVWYTANHTRKEKLKELCLSKGIDCRIYVKEDLI